ncbi:MAG TPA: TonB-dependent receptor [Acidobacteriaceae bacterium]
MMKFSRLYATATGAGSFQMPAPRSRQDGRFARLATLLFAASLGCLGAAHAQVTSGLRGRVADSSGAVIPNATVTVHNEKTGVDKVTKTTGAGDYAVPFLDVGVYDIRVEAAGFKAGQKIGLNIATDQTADASFRLVVGGANETVTVSAAADVLDYDKGDRGDIVDQRRIEQLPVNTGNTFNLAILSNGVTTTTVGQRSDNQTAQSMGIHGGTVEYNIDGVTDYSGTGAAGYSYPPPTSAVQEFKITTDPFDASFGRASGGSIDMTLKTGSRQLHGTGYEMLQRAFLNANTSSNNAFIAQAQAKGTSTQAYNKPASSQDQWGFELDGPVIIPKLYGANKQTFFTILFETLHQRGIGTLTATVPTTAMVNGDFSGLLTANGATYNQPIYDPLSEAACTANNTDNGSYAKGNPHVCRYQFGYGSGPVPGPQGNPVQIGAANVIPTNRLDPVAHNILTWFPAPNLAPNPTTANDFATNYIGATPNFIYDRLYLVKLDRNIGTSDTVDLTLKLWTNNGIANGAFPRSGVNAAHPGANPAASTAHFLSRIKDPSGSVAWTHTFSPRLVNNVKGSLFVTNQTDSTGPGNGFDPANLGFSSAIAANNPSYFDRFPLVNYNSYTNLGSITGLNRGDNEMQIIDTVNYVRGKHAMHFGVDLRRFQYSQRSSNAAGNGLNFTFDKGYTQQWDLVVTGNATNISTGGNYSGNAIASSLLGTAASGNATTQPDNYFSSLYYAGFFQDDWKVRSNLTLNLGIRWDTVGNGDVDRHDRLTSAFDSTDVNPISSLVNFSGLPFTSLNGGITFAGVAGSPRGAFNFVKGNFAPRLAFAYTATPRTVIRGGIGLFYSEATSGNGFVNSQTGFATTTNYTGTNDGGATPLQNFDNPFPVFQTPMGNCGGNKSACLVTNAGQALSFINPNYHPPMALQSSFGIEQQFSKWDTLELSYAGNRTYDLTYSDDLNHISAAAQAACDPERGGVGTNCTNTAVGAGYLTNPFKGIAPFAGTSYYTAATIQKINFTRPFPIFTGITESNLNGGELYYNALEATFNHRTSKGLTLHATYAFSKSISSAGYVDTVNRVQSRTIAGTDIPNRVTVSEVYQLPIARGRGMFPNMNRVLDMVVGGWQVSSVFLYQSGLPFAINGYEIDKNANGGYLLPRTRFFPGQSNPYHTQANANSYVQAFKPCVGTRDPNTGVVVLQAYSVTAGCAAANFIQVGPYGVTPSNEYTGVRNQRYVNVDANISKDFHIYERLTAQLRLDAFNLANHVTQFTTAYNTTVGDANFGTLQEGTAFAGNYSPRVIQITGRINF